MTPRAAMLALTAGNFVIGLSVIAPAGMIDPLAADLGVGVTTAALLVTAGAIVLCLGSPLVAWGASAIDRRRLLTVALVVLAACHAASIFAPDFSVLLAIRLVAMAFAAIFTPQAASAIAMMVPERDRPGAISFIFVGWSLAAAVGLPAVAWCATEYGWRSVHAGLATTGALAAAMVALSLPGGLRGAAMSLAGWGELFRNRLVVMLVGATALASAGQFIIFTYFGPLLARTASASAGEIAACFAVFGVSGLVGNIVASRVVGRVGALRTSLLFFSAMLTGATVWAAGAGSLAAAAIGSLIWGAGFAASNSMQQARLAEAVPTVAGAAIAMNSSMIYVGQAVGSAAGGWLFDRQMFVAMGWAAVAFLAVTLAIVAWSGRPTRALAGHR